jgi:hypothetical protein
MIYIIEVSHNNIITVWSKEKAQIMDVPYVFEKCSVADLIDNFFCDDRKRAEEAYPIIKDLPEDTMLYRADYLLPDGELTTEPIDEWEAYKAFLENDLESCLIFESTEEAEEAIKNDSLWEWGGFGEGFKARKKLIEELKR